MEHNQWLNKQAALTLERMRPRIEAVLEPALFQAFEARLNVHFPRLFRLLYSLYGSQYDFFYSLEQILLAAARYFAARPESLRVLDADREQNPLWYQSEKAVGGVCYVDRFAGDLDGIRARIPYFKELGLTYLHLMPVFLAPEENSDGGYAVSSYREVNPALGTMDDLQALASEMREEGISLVLDFVFNHTSNEHTWAHKAIDGDEHFQAYYRMFDDRSIPDQYEAHLREIFPEQDPGNFTYVPELGKWVWTTFRHFQWDLNYENPAVFNAMMQEMLFLANQGVEVLRLDAVAFVWKQMGTSCENLPQAHTIIQAFNALVQIVAPAMVFKSEAIVHPDFVAQYISPDECQISYNPTLMNLLWESLATREVRLLRHSMIKRFDIEPACTWVNYVRCHDDIGWSFADEDAGELGIHGFDHRQFLNAFYTGHFEGSFASGLPFNFNPRTLDMRISGMAASLAGLERALERDSALYIEHAIRRVLLIHSVILSIGGIPLLYLGDELATLNDYGYQSNPAIANDSRWVHRPQFDDERAALRTVSDSIPGRVFQMLQRLIAVRKAQPAFADGNTTFVDVDNPHVFAYARHQTILVLANFSEHPQVVSQAVLGRGRALPVVATDLVTGSPLTLTEDIMLEPYAFVWLKID